MMSRKEYVSPSLSELGSLGNVTATGTEPNTDVLGGKNNTAFPPATS